jgi:hypothetical protein
MKTYQSAVVSSVDSFFINRQDHDFLARHHQKFLLHLFEVYESRWNIDGVIFKDVSSKDNVKLQKHLSSVERQQYLQENGVLI